MSVGSGVARVGESSSRSAIIIACGGKETKALPTLADHSPQVGILRNDFPMSFYHFAIGLSAEKAGQVRSYVFCFFCLQLS